MENEVRDETIEETAETETSTALTTISTDDLKKESQRILNEIIAADDSGKTQSLVQLFNDNQNKKTMVRMDKLGNLLDVLTDVAYDRLTKNPNEISNEDVSKWLKTTQELYEKSQRQVNGANAEGPLIQINQQTNEVNVGDTSDLPDRSSRDRIKNFINSVLKDAKVANQTSDVIDVTNGEEEHD